MEYNSQQNQNTKDNFPFHRIYRWLFLRPNNLARALIHKNNRIKINNKKKWDKNGIKSVFMEI
jgi:hypothetical protein